MKDTRTEQEIIDAEIDTDDPGVDVDAKPTVAMIPADKAEDLVAVAADIAARVDATLRIRRECMRLTHWSDWRIHERMDEKGPLPPLAYLESKGAQRLAATLGIGWEGVTCEKETHIDSTGAPFYEYLVRGFMTWRGRRLPAMGGCNSRHKLLSLGGKIQSEDVNEIHVRKKAVTDFIRTGVCELLGMKDIPVEELPESYRARIQVQTYVQGNEGGKGEQTSIEKARAAELGKWISEMCNGDREACEQMLQDTTTFKGRDGEQVIGIRRLSLLRGKRLDITHAKIHEAYNKWIIRQEGGAE